MSLEPFKWSVRAAVVMTVALGLAGCGKRQPATGDSESRAKSTDFVQMDSETSDIERHCLEFGRSVFMAVAARNYEDFYGQLSSHAKAQMSLNSSRQMLMMRSSRSTKSSRAATSRCRSFCNSWQPRRSSTAHL